MSRPAAAPTVEDGRLHGVRTVVVGGGLGGLAVAVRLAARGARVTVCERGPQFGGKMNLWESGPYRFDTGPSLITMPWVFDETFRAAGARLDDHLTLLPVQPLAEYTFADGTRLRANSWMPEWLETIRRLEPGDEDGFWRFMALGARIFELSQATFFRRTPWARPDREVLRALRHMPLGSGWGNYHRTVAAHFRNPLLRQLYDRYPTYVGSSPYHAPATLAVIPYIEHAFGGWYVRGGLYRIVQALVSLAAAHGVELLTGAAVERIEHAQRRVHGVRLAGGRHMPADVVVVNADPSVAASLLYEPAVSLPPADRSLSGIVFLLGLRRTRPELPHHAVCFSGDYHREFEELFGARRFPEDPTVYVNTPSRSDRSVVGGGEGETVFVMANAPADAAGWDTAAVAEAERRIFDRLRRSRFPELAADVAVRDVWTPARFESAYAAPGGALYGTHSHGWRRAFLRPPNRDRRIRGLYYVGGGTHPGGGTPTVLMSARITSALIEGGT